MVGDPIGNVHQQPYPNTCYRSMDQTIHKLRHYASLLFSSWKKRRLPVGSSRNMKARHQDDDDFILASTNHVHIE